MKELYMVLVLLIVNSIAAIVYVIYMWKKDKSLQRAMIGGGIIFLTLGVGAIFFFASAIIRYLLNRLVNKEVLYDEISFDKTKTSYYNIEDVNKARDIIPIEEAAIITNKHSARSYFLNLLKDDYGNYIESIYDAIQNPDSEISHYAATAIVDIVESFKSEFPLSESKFQTHGEMEQFLKRSTEFLSYKILSDTDRIQYSYKLEEFVLKRELTENIIYYMTELYISQDKYERAEAWINRLPEEHGIVGYKAQLYYYFTSNQKTAFKEKLQELKSKDIALDHQLLDLVRIYS